MRPGNCLTSPRCPFPPTKKISGGGCRRNIPRYRAKELLKVQSLEKVVLWEDIFLCPKGQWAPARMVQSELVGILQARI